MADPEQVTAALKEIYGANDWLMTLNFRALLVFSGLRRVDRSSRILDCGCAMGHFMRLLIDNGLPEVTGLDASPDMVESATRFTSRPVVLGDALVLTQLFSPASFDIITAMNLQHHFGGEGEWESFVRGCWGLLAQGGLLVCREPAMTWSFACLWWMSHHPVFFRSKLLKGRLLSIQEERPLLSYFFSRWPAFFPECLARCGFDIVKDVHWMGHRIVTARKRGDKGR